MTRPMVDLRSLALFRVLLACAVCIDLLQRAGNLVDHYTDDGVLPRATLIELKPSADWFSFHLINGGETVQAATFILAIGLAISMLVGFRARASCLVLWLLTISLQFRNPYLTEGYDVYVRQLLFWASLSPLSAIWSVDAVRAPVTSAAAKSFSSAPVVALLLQVLVLYLFSGLHKLQNPVWVSGEALYYTLAGHGFYARSFSAALTFSPVLLMVATYFILAIEIAYPILLVIRPNSPRLRSAFVISMAALHVGILVSLDVGLFSVVSLAALALFLPSEFWTIVEPHRQRLVRVFVGRARQWLGERAWARAIDLMSSRPGPQPLAEQPRWRTCVQGVLTVAIMSYVVWISFYQLLPQQVPRIPTDVRNVASFFRFNQKFALFAYVSDEPTFDQLHAIGLLEDGSRRFLMDGSIYDPERIAAGYRASFPSHRWVKWFIKMRRDERIHRPFAEYQCRASVSAEPGSRLQRVELRLVSVSLDGVPLRDERMLSHDCALLP